MMLFACPILRDTLAQIYEVMLPLEAQENSKARGADMKRIALIKKSAWLIVRRLKDEKKETISIQGISVMFCLVPK